MAVVAVERMGITSDPNRPMVASIRTFATLMSRGGVAPRVAQAAMRHCSIDLAMSVYTDPTWRGR